MNLTDTGNAERLVKRFGSGIRFCPQMREWFVWRNTRWERDESGEVYRMAKDVAREMTEAAPDSDGKNPIRAWGLQSESEQHINAMVRLAQSEPGVAIRAEAWDRDPWMLNLANTTLDLRTGQPRPHRRADHLTIQAPVAYDPDATSAVWETFLATVVPDAETRRFVQKAAGYSLTGDIREEVLFFLHGGGCNGKSTFVNTIAALMGGYACQCASQSLMRNTNPNAPRNDLARLKGSRFVATSEAGAEAVFDEDIVKRMTGDDPITARFLHKEFVSFLPTWKVWFMANHRPNIPGTDHAIWRRIRLVPFQVQISDAERDPMLKWRLTRTDAEWPGVLNWLLEGLRLWQDEGLGMSPEVADATTYYRRDMDMLGAFLEEQCRVCVGGRVLVSDVYKRYLAYCSENVEKPLGKKAFGAQLASRGDGSIRTRKFSHGWCWTGIRLLSPDEKGEVSLHPDDYAEED